MIIIVRPEQNWTVTRKYMRNLFRSRNVLLYNEKYVNELEAISMINTKLIASQKFDQSAVISFLRMKCYYKIMSHVMRVSLHSCNLHAIISI